MNKKEAKSTVLIFGKYKDKSLKYVLVEDPGYLKWLLSINLYGKLSDALHTLEDDIDDAYRSEYFPDDLDDIIF